MRKQHIEIGNEEAFEGVAKSRLHKRSTLKKARKKSSRKKAQKAQKS